MEAVQPNSESAGENRVSVHSHVEFRSDRFPADDGEEQQVNPGLWRKRLAEFLRDNLRNERFERKKRSQRTGAGSFR
jgi:hypothetical protein